MIQIDSISITEFRGIRSLTLALDAKSYLVWGPNGSGKSGVVDAIDFVLTGNVNRLSGSGLGAITVLKHGPHVLRRGDPASSVVSATVRDTLSGKAAVLSRCVKTSAQFTLTPDIPEVRAAVQRAQAHPEIALSRRDIIKYIVAQPTNRAQQVQSLLKLEQTTEIRKLLKTTQGKISADQKAAQANVKMVEDAMRRHVDAPDLQTDTLLGAVNPHRRILGLPDLTAIDRETALNEGVDTESSATTFNKSSALRDISALHDWLDDLTTIKRYAAALDAALGTLEEDPTVLDALKQRSLVADGLKQVVDLCCPLCDSEWPNEDELRAHLKSKLKRSDTAGEIQKEISDQATRLTSELRILRGLLKTAKPLTVSHGQSGFSTTIDEWSESLVAFETRLESIELALGQRARLLGDILVKPVGTDARLIDTVAAIKAEPDLSTTATARSFLILAQERWQNVKNARKQFAQSDMALKAVQIIYQTYCDVADSALTKLYRDVEVDFSNFYRFINGDDEKSFKAEFKPSAGKLDLSVDFYGIGQFPPSAYHSEGHQDGMGVCLYLALIKRLLGADFRFAVLDDVVMSVDVNHRRQFCELLKAEFSDVQFIITTHDEVWARQIQKSGLVAKKNQARFHGWTVNDGPAYEDGIDFWDKIEVDLSSDDVPSAAAKLRRNLEAILTDLTSALKGQVVYQSDARYELGELLASVKAQHNKLLGVAASAANSWASAADVARTKALQEERKAATLSQDNESWAINPAVHFNDWASFSSADFRPVVQAWRTFLDLFLCANDQCTDWIYLVENGATKEELRCRCGGYSLNLRKK